MSHLWQLPRMSAGLSGLPMRYVAAVHIERLMADTLMGHVFLDSARACVPHRECLGLGCATHQRTRKKF
jgi:hypothetical protein